MDLTGKLNDLRPTNRHLAEAARVARLLEASGYAAIAHDVAALIVMIDTHGWRNDRPDVVDAARKLRPSADSLVDHLVRELRGGS